MRFEPEIEPETDEGQCPLWLIMTLAVLVSPLGGFCAMLMACDAPLRIHELAALVPLIGYGGALYCVM